MDRILVAVDLPESSALVVSRAVELARSMGSELIALHVYDPEVLMQTLADSGMPPDQYIAVLESDLIRIAIGAGAQGVRVRADVAEGDAVGATILKVAERLRADLIVMGTHGRTGVMRTILGSVAEDVLRHAVRPVLIVPLRSAAVPAPAVSGASAS